MTKKVYKLKIFFSIVTKNPNWEILTKNLVEHVKKKFPFWQKCDISVFNYIWTAQCMT